MCCSVATHSTVIYSVLQYVGFCCSVALPVQFVNVESVAVFCSTLQRVAAHCSALHCVAARCTALQCAAVLVPILLVDLECAVHTLQHTATRCNTLQHTATHCNTVLVPILLVDLECAVVDAADTLDVGTPLDPPVTTPEERCRRRPPSGELSLEASGLRARESVCICVSVWASSVWRLRGCARERV